MAVEKKLEQKFVKAVKANGGICPKLVSPGFDGMPDRMALLPGERILFVEVKAPGKKPRPIQELRHRQLSELGFEVYVLDDPERIPEILGGDDNAGGAEVKGREHTYRDGQARPSGSNRVRRRG